MGWDIMKICSVVTSISSYATVAIFTFIIIIHIIPWDYPSLPQMLGAQG